MNKILCRTLFDITETGVKHNFNPGRLPWRDDTGRVIEDQETWLLARNQQRNWETMLQLLSLRTQPQDLSGPQEPSDQDPWWQFEFTVDNIEALRLGEQELGQLEQDCSMVPMLTGLKERVAVTSMLIPGVNLVFSAENP